MRKGLDKYGPSNSHVHVTSKWARPNVFSDNGKSKPMGEAEQRNLLKDCFNNKGSNFALHILHRYYARQFYLLADRLSMLH